MNKKMLIYKVICTIVIIAAAILLLTGVFNKKDSMYHLADRSKIGPLTKEDVSYRTVAAPTQTLKDGTIGAEAWKEIYPYITQTMYANARTTAPPAATPTPLRTSTTPSVPTQRQTA